MNISRGNLWILFSTCALPIHIWTFISYFRDFSWISERTNPWDAIGVGAYGLIIALFESILVFCVGLLISLVLPKRWKEKIRVTLIGVTISVISGWAIVGQLYYFYDYHFPVTWLQWIARMPHPLWVVYGSSAMAIGLTLLLPIYGIYKSPRLSTRIFKIFESWIPLTTLYLFFDLTGLIIVVIRNL